MDPAEKFSPEEEAGEDQRNGADALIVFGFGIKDPLWMQKEKEGTDLGESEGWMLSLGAKMRVQAATELYLRGATREVIFTGGATRQKDQINQTEAELMQNYFLHILRKRKFEELKGERTELNEIERRDIENACSTYIEGAKDNLIKEDGATNTIENFSRTLAMFDKNPDRYKKVALLSNRFHMARIKQLAEQFDLEASAFNAEDTILATRLNKRHGQMVYDTLNAYTDPNTNEEYRNFLIAENRWSRGLRELPEYFLPQTVFVQGPRLKNILAKMAAAEARYEKKLQEIGIDPERLDDYDEDELREKISQIQRELPPESWAE